MKLPKVCSAILATFTKAQEIVNFQCLGTMRERGSGVCIGLLVSLSLRSADSIFKQVNLFSRAIKLITQSMGLGTFPS